MDKLAILTPFYFPDDPCFYSGNLLDLSEYVLNKSGSIWMGATTDHYGHFRQLSQFGKNSLEAAFLALTKMSLNDRADPVKVPSLARISSD